MLDGPSLETFLALAEHRHFVRAADHLGIAQSVASKRLARLEDALGTRLLERGNRRQIELTRAGALFLEEARTALTALQSAERIGLAFARGAAGPLRVGYVFSAAMTGVLPRLVTALRSALPELAVTPSLMETPAQIRAISEGSVDIAIVRPRPSWPERTQFLATHREPLMIGLGETMDIAQLPELRPRDLRNQTFLTPQFEEQVGLAEMVRDLARAADGGPPIIRATGDFITAACLAAAGEGIVLAPDSLRNLHLSGLVFRPLRDFCGMLDLNIIARRETPAIITDTIAATFRHSEVMAAASS